ncbi:MAG TPA: NAD(P)H-hydrate dehydratase [Pyrinomonadaceae bacterium]|nr:NAD(P)H-hydrate dehydratase [Pyrinomonadaceae bacterium]
MQKILSAAEMREVDRLTVERFATPSLLLMESAAHASARAIAAHFPSGLQGERVQILCGRGNNGGDGAALGRALWTLGAHVDIVLFGRAEESKGDARANFEIVRCLSSFASGTSERPSGLSYVECRGAAEWEEVARGARGYAVIVDALFGTGLTRPLEGVFRQVVEHLSLVREARRHARAALPLVVSLDLPSGLNADAAEPIGEAVRADLTVTFTAPKPANVLPPASHFNGRLIVAHIGSPDSLLDHSPSRLFLTEGVDVRAWLEKTRYGADSYKYMHGHVLVLAGSRNYTGAAVLCANAAMRSGAGLVTAGAPVSALPSVAARLMPEVITAAFSETPSGALSFDALARISELAARATVVAIGPGLTSDHEETRKLVREFVERRHAPVVLDADALNALAAWPSELRGTRRAPLILTPHAGEMLRLLGTDDRAALQDRVRVASEFAQAHELILVLKGTRTLVAAPDGRVFINPTGNAGLGRGGSGDTLTGVVAGFLAQAFAALKDDADALEATIAAVYVCGLAGDLAARERGMRTMVATDVAAHLSDAMMKLDEEGERP